MHGPTKIWVCVRKNRKNASRVDMQALKDGSEGMSDWAQISGGNRRHVEQDSLCIWAQLDMLLVPGTNSDSCTVLNLWRKRKYSYIFTVTTSMSIYWGQNYIVLGKRHHFWRVAHTCTLSFFVLTPKNSMSLLTSALILTKSEWLWPQCWSLRKSQLNVDAQKPPIYVHIKMRGSVDTWDHPLFVLGTHLDMCVTSKFDKLTCGWESRPRYGLSDGLYTLDASRQKKPSPHYV